MEQLRIDRGYLAERLRRARERAGVSREEAAQAADVQPAAVEAWEKGRSTPCPVQFGRLIASYGASVHRVLFGQDQLALSREEASELRRAAQAFSPRLRARIDVMLALYAEAGADRARAP